jgi:hypothetical protein
LPAEDCKGESVHRIIVGFAQAYLRCHVSQGTSISCKLVRPVFQPLVGVNFFCKTKIKDLDVAPNIESYIIWLQIAVDDAKAVSY